MAMAIVSDRPLVRYVPALLAALLLACAWALPATAQQSAAPGAASQAAESVSQSETKGASTEELQDLVDTLKDDAERQVFLDRLQALVEAKRSPEQTQEKEPKGLGSQLLQAVTGRMDVVGDQLGEVVGTLERIPSALLNLWSELQTAEARDRWIDIALTLVMILGGAVLAERIVHFVLRSPRRRLESKANDSLVLRLLFLFGRTLLDAVPIVAFAAAAYGIITVVQPRSATQLVAVTLINASVLSRALTVSGRAVLAPYAPQLRLPNLPDETAAYLFIWLRRVGATAIYGYFAVEAFVVLGVGAGTTAAIEKLLGLVIAALVIVFLLQNRQEVARWLRGRDGESAALRGVRQRLAEMWHVLGVIYVLAIYGVWALQIEGGFAFLVRATLLTIAVVIGAKVVRSAMERLIDRGFHLSDEMRDKYPGLEARANRYLPGLRRAGRIAVFVFGALLILQIWGAGALSWLASDAGLQLMSRGATIVVLVLLAFIVWELISAFVERVLTRSNERDSAKRSARMMTLLPLLRNAVRIVLIVVVALIILSEIGVNIGPLLAGAGVIGLAVGFGAQTLVKDVITGVFILVEDSLAVGDWVDLGGHGGEVESMTIRTITLRDLHGQLHVVPFSEVTSILNMGRDYGYAVIDIGVAYREDTDAVTKLLERIGAEMREDEDWGPKIIGDLEVFGVNNLSDSAVEIRVRMKTKVLAHWSVRREFLRRAKHLFDQEGVEIPFPHRTLYFGIDKDGSAPPARVAMQQPPKEIESEATSVQGEPEQKTSTTPTDDPDGE